MNRVIIVTFDGAQSLDVTGPAEVFATASRVRSLAEGTTAAAARLYDVQVASVGGGLRTTTAGVRIETRDLVSVRPRASDVVIVAGGEAAGVRAAAGDAKLLAWVAHAHATARVMASVCSGAFVLAAAGILDGRRATTHWSACEQLTKLFPAVTVDANAIFVEDRGVWTSAGVTTGIDMALALVEADHGLALADGVASRLVLYVRRPGFQSQFSDALVTQTTDDEGLGPAIAWARANLAKADVDRLARRAALSVRTLHRRCQETLGMTPAKLIDKLRVEHARSLLETRDLPAKRLAIQCGFGNPARMNRAFARELGMSPKAYRMMHAARRAT